MACSPIRLQVQHQETSTRDAADAQESALVTPTVEEEVRNLIAKYRLSK